MRVLLIAAGVVLAACTPRDNRDSDLELRESPDSAVHAEPTVTGGAYDSITYRVIRERDSLSPGSPHPAGAPAAELDH